MKKKELEKAYKILEKKQLKLMKELALLKEYIKQIKKERNYWKDEYYAEANKSEEFRMIAREANKKAYELQEQNKHLAEKIVELSKRARWLKRTYKNIET